MAGVFDTELTILCELGDLKENTNGVIKHSVGRLEENVTFNWW